MVGCLGHFSADINRKALKTINSKTVMTLYLTHNNIN